MVVYKTTIKKMNNKSSLIDLLYEIAPEPKYWSNIVSDLEKIALSNIDSGKVVESNDKALTFENDGITQEQRDILGSVLPHLQRVMSIQQKFIFFEQKSDLTASLIESMPMGIMVVDKNNSVASQNRLASRLCENSQLINILDGELSILGKSLTQFVQENKLSKKQSNEESTHAFLNNDFENLSLLVTGSKSENHYIIFISDDKGQEYISRRSLQQLFPVTNAEADLCIHLIHGLSIEEIAEIRHTSVKTTRTQFKNIFRKTRINGQVHLVRKILTSLARISIEDYIHSPVKETKKEDHGQSKTLKLGSGRVIGYAEYGSPDGYPVVYCHSMFGSRSEHPASKNIEGCRVIIPERPGFGLSDKKENSNYISWVKDLEVLLKYLNISEFSIAGLSIGAIYAAAVASLMNDRVTHYSAINIPPKLNSWRDLQHVSSNIRFFSAFSMYMPSVACILLEKECTRLRGNTSKVIERLAESDIDKQTLMSDGVRLVVDKCFSECLINDFSHISNEVSIYTREWGIPINQITCPVDVWLGEKNHHSPLKLVEDTLREVNNKRIHLIPEQGLYMYFEYWPKILAHAMKTISKKEVV